MSINDISQKKTLLNKIGLGTPKMSSNIRMNQPNPPSPKPSQPAPPSPKPQPSQPKPGCGGCRRKRSS